MPAVATQLAAITFGGREGAWRRYNDNKSICNVMWWQKLCSFSNYNFTSLCVCVSGDPKGGHVWGYDEDRNGKILSIYAGVSGCVYVG